jgi:hypothetical protein
VLKSILHKLIAVKTRHGETNNPIKQQTNNCLPTLPYCTLPYSSVPSRHLPMTHHNTSHFVPCLEHSSTTALARFSLGPAMDQEVSRQTARTGRQAWIGIVKISITARLGEFNIRRYATKVQISSTDEQKDIQCT